MADSQPGKVTTFDPSVTLDSFIADARDRLMYNENQLVLAKVQRPVPVSAVSYDSTIPLVRYEKYVNVGGEFAYTDGSYQALKTSGVPVTDVNTIEVAYDQQVTTSTVKFWSTAFVTTSLSSPSVDFSFDDNTYFPAGDITWVQTRDETVQQFPGENPASGIYVYEGTFDEGAKTGRYWRLSGAAGGANFITEIEVLPNTGAILEHWGSDGVKAVTNQVEGVGYYDITYDKADDVYYAIRFDATLPSSLVLEPNDDFNSLTDGSLFDATKWVESDVNSYFVRSTASGTLGMKSSAGNGQLETNYGIEGSFEANIELVAALELNADAYFGLEAKDYATNNQYALSALQGPYTPGVDTSGTFITCYIAYTDTVGGSAVLQDFRVKADGFDFTDNNGIAVPYDFIYNAGTGDYTVTASGVTDWPNATPGVPYTALDSAEFTISNLVTPSDGQGFSVNVHCIQNTIVGTLASGIQLEVGRQNTNAYLKYQDTDAPGLITAQVGNMPDTRVKVQVYGNPAGLGVNVSADNFTLGLSPSLFFNSPVFSVVTINKDGNLEQVPSVSDADGYAIKILDVIQDLSASYNDYLYPNVGIATNGVAHGSGGEIYIKVNDTLYRYLKSVMPLVSEDGSSAATTTTAEIPTTGITAFAYNGYTQGGLSFVEYVPGLSGTFVKTIDASSLVAQPEKAFLDVPTDLYPFAWNVVDLSTLYYVDGTALKLYDLNETKAAFANVSSDKQILAAGTQETAIITAQILNVYGEPKTNKTMTFSVSAGDGAISPAIGCSDNLGDTDGSDTTTYTVGSAVGAATITVTVSDLIC